MKWWIATPAMLAACGFSSTKTGDAPDGGVPVDVVALDASTRFGTIFPVVLSKSPTGPVNVIAQDLDIDTGPSSAMCDAAVLPYCAIAGTSFTVAAGRKIRGHGARPLVLVSTSTFDLNGDIDVSSGLDAAGAGTVLAIDCGTVIPPPIPATVSSGGFGGSFGGKGGNGFAVGGIGGQPTTFISPWPSTLRGGCPGGQGAAGAQGGAGGAGGGAVSIIADSINLNGKINASGGGGRGGGPIKGGGGGGGSGGMIVLDVPAAQVTLNGGVVFANGGGGGEGGTMMGAGTPGMDGRVSSGPMVGGGGGGTSATEGGNGGDGSVGTIVNGGSASDQVGPSGGGGGGGGAAGMIYAPSLSGAGINVIAPPPTAVTL